MHIKHVPLLFYYVSTTKMTENIINAKTLQTNSILPHLIPVTRSFNNNNKTMPYNTHSSLDGAGIAGILLLGTAIIFWVVLLCACFHARCLLEDEHEEKRVEMTEV